jgi:hypothetical protein
MALMTMMMAICVSPDDTHLLLLLLLWHAYAGWYADVAWRGVAWWGRYLNGHSDVVMGMVLTNSDEIKTRLRFLQNGIGAVPSPFDCFLAMRGMKTLHLRMREHAKNALHIAQFLESHPKVHPPCTRPPSS